MSAAALPSVGTVLRREDPSTPGTFADISEATAITPMNGSTEIIDGSDLSSRWREKKAGMQDGGQLQFTVHLVPNAHQVLVDDWKAAETRTFQIEYPDGSTQDIDGIVTNVSPTVQMASTLQCSFTVEITGEPGDFESTP